MKLVWDAIGEHLYETGVDRGVLYQYNSQSRQFVNGVAWNGLTAVNESPSGAEPTALYADNIKYLNLISAEEYAATIEAFTAPDEFLECDGFASLADGVVIGQQPRKMFGFCYRTLIGSDTDGTNKGYKLHLVYNCTASPSERSHSTVNESPEAATMSWSVSTTSVNVPGKNPTAIVEVDSTKVDPAKLATLEDVLYGDADSTARLPFPEEVAQIVGTAGVTVKLSALSIGSLDLAPDFNPNVTEYTAVTENATDTVTATGADGASVTLFLNGTAHTSGTAATWNAGTNTVVAIVTKSGATSRTYTVTVTKEAE